MKNAASPYNPRSSHKTQNSSITTYKSSRSHSNPFIYYLRKLAGVFTIFIPRQKKNPTTATQPKNKIQIEAFSSSTDVSTASYSRSSSKFKFSNSYGSSSNRNGPVGTLNFSIEEIFKATSNFSAANKIGEGGFGTVYKGKLADGSLVAVKRAKKNDYDKRLSMEFKNEVLALSKIEHLNLVRFHGYVEHGDERIIVVEYVGNGTLRQHLDGMQGKGLEIGQRLDIAIDVAHAIAYLHMYSDPPIIHRDIKASNILITDKLRAKVADFGFARLGSDDPGTTHISTQIKGTSGYLDPEYLRTYTLTEKSDVYSFGVLLVEIVTGRTPIDQTRPLKERVTIRWAMQKLKEKEAVLAMDLKLRRSPSSVKAVEEVLELAKRCLSSLRPSRPSMKECAEVLWKIRKDFKEGSLHSSMASAAHQSANFPHRNVKKAREQTFGIEEGESYKFISA